MAETKENRNEIGIELSDAVAEGIYSNMAVISHSSSEFVADFIRVLPGIPKAQVKSRIILTPEHAKRLLLSLEDNIRKYESVFGEISIPQPRGEAPDFPVVYGKGQA